MTTDVSQQVDAFVTPGTMLRSARLARELSCREVEDQLNLMPGYADIIEHDDYQALRSPAFARGYVRAYGQLMDLDEVELLEAFDEQRSNRAEEKKRVETKPLQLQRTGAGVVVGLGILVLLFVGLWWWQGRGEAPAEQPAAEVPDLEAPALAPTQAPTQAPEGEQ